MDHELKIYLEKYNINFIEHKHLAVFTVEESKKIKLNYTGAHTKSLFLKDENSKFYLICMAGEKRLNIKFLKSYLNVKDLQFASSDELKRVLNITPGSVSIFCLINTTKRVHLIIDKQIWNEKTVGFHPNVNTATLEISHKNLEKFYNSLKERNYRF
ncbi:prolyl-tRNA synthetase associated domain-containing protein [Candidatus Pacearchaeota archaeon]|nr:prolyl-tRNA synthetase associated domain-containing protein [Candidatus Pacearchaeota archaeon]